MSHALVVVGGAVLALLVLGGILLFVAWKMGDSPLGRMDTERL